jgi:hypothetical protein
VAKAQIAIPAYLEGSYQTQLKSLERGLSWPIPRSCLSRATSRIWKSRAMPSRSLRPSWNWGLQRPRWRS